MQGKTVLTNVYLLEEDRDYLKKIEKVRGDFSREIRIAVHDRVEHLKSLEKVASNNECE